MLIYEFIVMSEAIVTDIYELVVMNKVSHSYLTRSCYIYYRINKDTFYFNLHDVLVQQICKFVYEYVQKNPKVTLVYVSIQLQLYLQYIRFCLHISVLLFYCAFLTVVYTVYVYEQEKCVCKNL